MNQKVVKLHFIGVKGLPQLYWVMLQLAVKAEWELAVGSPARLCGQRRNQGYFLEFFK